MYNSAAVKILSFWHESMFLLCCCTCLAVFAALRCAGQPNTTLVPVPNGGFDCLNNTVNTTCTGYCKNDARPSGSLPIAVCEETAEWNITSAGTCKVSECQFLVQCIKQHCVGQVVLTMRVLHDHACITSAAVAAH